MSLESGGRADKYGNTYENRYLARLLLRLLNEEVSSIVVEPLGVDGEGVEYITTSADGTKAYYQCKASNTTHNTWSISDLNHYKVFERSKAIVERNASNRYFFISPLQYNGLDELCKRARTNMSAQDFSACQLSNPTYRALFHDCAQYYALDEYNPEALNRLVNILAHCYFEQRPTGIEAEQDLNQYIGIALTGKADSARMLLEQYVNSKGRYGVTITAKEILDFLGTQNIYPRNYHCDSRVLTRITKLNDIYWGIYHPINDFLIHRTATDIAIEKYQAGYSLIIHGKAGSGKSGCIQEFIDYLNKAHILYLGIKLDKEIPDVSADEYGKRLGLPESPVYCLNTLSAGEPCVLILDQLDSLRWTSSHSASALDVCKEIISQAAAINKYKNGKISIIFVSRTFDLENDKGLRALFETSNSEHGLTWEKICVSLFSEKEVAQIVGSDYETLSHRLKELLQTPSSLYVWSQLEKQAKTNNILSVYQLMDIWWNQVQEHCSLAGISREEAQSCKSNIVAKMDENSMLSLPVQLFSDHKRVIEVFISNGLLTQSRTILSFTHQSFLDYFIAAETLMEIYSKQNLPDIIGPSENQTPNLRYRLLIVLQNLLDADRPMFVKQSKIILAANSVRYYFKCAVFEVIGQCENPDKTIYDLVQTYFDRPEWKDYLRQTVYYGHPAFVIHLKIVSGQAWLKDENLTLLKSISSKVPSFVVDTLLPYAFNTAEDNKRIFWALCHDPVDDSDYMFQFRVELLKRFPDLFNNFWGFSSLIKQQSVRAVYLLKYILEENEKQLLGNIYLGENHQLEAFARTNYKEIIDELFPIICKITNCFSPPWPHYTLNDQYRSWISHEYNESTARKIVECVKIAFQESAQSNSDNTLQFIEHLQYPISIIGHEIIMHAISNLPVEYCDRVIQWLLTDFENKVFVYSSNEMDFLCYAKLIIKKFSSSCSTELFRQLEKKICAWKDSTNQMVSIYKNRIKVNGQCQWEAVYYAYWGHFQKELLPTMKKLRLSSYAQELINVLNRNSWIRQPFYYSGFSCGPAKSVVSPIDGYTNRISDKCWLKIISTPNEKMKDHWRGDDSAPCYIEATHQSFSSALSKQAKLQPTRFAKLSLLFSANCYPGYISSVIYAMGDCDAASEKPDVTLMSNVIRQHAQNGDRNIAIEIARLLEKRAEVRWPKDILDLLENLALKHPEPAANEYVITSSTDPENSSPNSLMNNSINCVRGCALHAIAALLWNHRDLSKRFRSTIEAASSDSNAAVRFAVVSCILPYYNIDPQFSAFILKNLLSADLRILAAPECWEILSREYRNEPDYYREHLSVACRSDIAGLAENAAGLMCAVALFFHDRDAFSQLTTSKYTDKQVAKICTQAVSSFNQEEYHEHSQEILSHFIETCSSELFALNRLFFDRCIVIERDRTFLISLMQSRQGVYLVNAFLNYLSESNEDITEYADVLKAVGESAVSAPSEWNSRLAISDLIQCVIHLFDRGKNNLKIRNICLNIWDNLFRSNLQDIKPLSDMIDNFE